jgi:hypothetical protein
MAQDWEKKVSQKKWEDDCLIDMLKIRAEQGDTSASAELELIEIERSSFVSPAPAPTPMPYISPLIDSINSCGNLHPFF